MNPTITIISSTNRQNALTRIISEYYQKLLEAKNIPSQILDLSGLPQDFVYSALYENSGKNTSFNAYQKVIDESEKFIFIIPEYNGSFPGVLKTFVDGLRYPDSFQGKKAALVGLSAGIQGGALALSHWNDILSYLGTDVMSLRVKLYQIQNHFKEGKITHPMFQELLEQQLEKFINF